SKSLQLPFQSLPPALHSCALRMLRHPAPATLCGPTSRWASTATAPGARTPPVPCTLATVPTGAAAILPLRHCRGCCSCSTPPAACLPLLLRAPSRPLRALPRAPPAALRSLPTQCDSHAPSPENHSAPQTLSSHPPHAAPSLPSGTSARQPLP